MMATPESTGVQSAQHPDAGLSELLGLVPEPGPDFRKEARVPLSRLHYGGNPWLPVGQSLGLMVPVKYPWFHATINNSCDQVIARPV